MAKSQRKKIYKIKDVIEKSGLSRQVIHNYTVMGLIHPFSKTAKGHRLYSERVFRRLELIRDLQETGLTLRDIADLHPFQKRK